MNKRAPIAVLLGLCAAGLAATVLGDGLSTKANAAATASCNIPQGSERVRLNPADFTTRIDNPFGEG